MGIPRQTRIVRSALLVTIALTVAGCVTTSSRPIVPATNADAAAKDNLELGISYLRQGKLQAAREKLERAIRAEPDMARAHAVLRRTGAVAPTSVLTAADLVLDDDAHRVTRGGVEVSLSPTEYNLLHYLLVNKGRAVSKAQILDHVWQYDFGGDGGVVETYIGYLRKKIDHNDPKLIHTLRGGGYSLRDQ